MKIARWIILWIVLTVYICLWCIWWDWMATITFLVLFFSFLVWYEQNRYRFEKPEDEDTVQVFYRMYRHNEKATFSLTRESNGQVIEYQLDGVIVKRGNQWFFVQSGCGSTITTPIINGKCNIDQFITNYTETSYSYGVGIWF